MIFTCTAMFSAGERTPSSLQRHLQSPVHCSD